MCFAGECNRLRSTRTQALLQEFVAELPKTIAINGFVNELLQVERRVGWILHTQCAVTCCPDVGTVDLSKLLQFLNWQKILTKIIVAWSGRLLMKGMDFQVSFIVLFVISMNVPCKTWEVNSQEKRVIIEDLQFKWL